MKKTSVIHKRVLQVLGHLMSSRGAIWLAYLLLGEALACVLTYLLLLLYVRTRLTSRHVTPRHEHHVLSDHVTEDREVETPLHDGMDHS